MTLAFAIGENLNRPQWERIVAGVATEHATTAVDISYGHTRPGIALPEPGSPVLIIGSALDGPMPSTWEAVLLAASRGLQVAAVILMGLDSVDDEEMVELVEMEFRELLADNGFDDNRVPFLRVRGRLDDDELRALNARLSIGTATPEGWSSTDEKLRVFVQAVGGLRRVSVLQAAALARIEAPPHAALETFQHEVRTVVDATSQHWDGVSLTVWLTSPNPHLSGATPVDWLARFGTEGVVRALDAGTWGVYA